MEPKSSALFSLKIASLIVVLVMTINGTLRAQTCSCAGAPLLSSQGAGAYSAGNLLLGVTYEYHDISALYNKSNALTNNEVSRVTQSTLLEAHYGISDRVSLSGTFTYVHKNRTTGLHNPDNVTELTTGGIGDGLFLLKYVMMQQTLWNPVHIGIGAGTKAPLGSSSLENEGIALNADMQPGTGAWDGVLWSEISVSLLPYTTANLFWQNSYRRTGTNERFGAGDNYRFGNELVSTLSVADRIVERLSYMIQLRFRSTASDQRNGNNLPNTGGKWLSVAPALTFGITDRVSARLSGRMPVYQYLNGTQPTTSWAVSGSLFFNFNSSEQEFIYGSSN